MASFLAGLGSVAAFLRRSGAARVLAGLVLAGMGLADMGLADMGLADMGLAALAMADAAGVPCSTTPSSLASYGTAAVLQPANAPPNPARPAPSSTPRLVAHCLFRGSAVIDHPSLVRLNVPPFTCTGRWRMRARRRGVP